MDKRIKNRIVMALMNASNHSMNKSILMRKVFAFDGISSKDLHALVTELALIDMVEITPLENDFIYTMPQRQVDELNRLFARRMM